MNPSLNRLLAEYPIETLLQTIPTGLFLTDIDKIIVYWNAEASRITGYSANDAVGQHCSFLQGNPCQLECELFSVTTPKPSIGLTCSFQHKDGQTLILTKNVDLLRDKDGQIIGGIESFVDISRLKELETGLRAAVRESTQELEVEKEALWAVLDGMIDPAYICDTSYRIFFANQAMLDMIGAIDNKPCYQAIYKKDQPCDDCPLQRVLQGEIVHQEKVFSETGRVYEVLHSPYPTAKNVTHKLSVSRDITERLEYRRRLQQTNRELDAFVATVSHDLRSPLTPLIGFAELLEERYGEQLDAIGQDCIVEIKKTAKKMEVLLEDLLSLSRVGQLKPPESPVDVASIVEDVLFELAEKVVARGAKIEIGPLPEIKISDSLLTNLFRNLINNALNYAADKNPNIEVSGQKFFDRVRYKVVDHGPGIVSAEREEIFEPFKRGSNSKGSSGAGIGLASVARIARVSGGRVWVEATVGGGATFIVDVPIS